MIRRFLINKNIFPAYRVLEVAMHHPVIASIYLFIYLFPACHHFPLPCEDAGATHF